MFPWGVEVRYPAALIPPSLSAGASPFADLLLLHDSVSRSFEKCVIEAVSSACQVTSLSCMGLQGVSDVACQGLLKPACSEALLHWLTLLCA